jgi:hypothetical protein
MLLFKQLTSFRWRLLFALKITLVSSFIGRIHAVEKHPDDGHKSVLWQAMCGQEDGQKQGHMTLFLNLLRCPKALQRGELQQLLRPQIEMLHRRLPFLQTHNRILEASQDDTNLIESLQNAGTNVNAQDSEGWTTLMMAARCSRAKVVKLLLGVGVMKLGLFLYILISVGLLFIYSNIACYLSNKDVGYLLYSVLPILAALSVFFYTPWLHCDDDLYLYLVVRLSCHLVRGSNVVSL